TYIDDGLDALMKILKNEGRMATGQIFNLGNPKNNCTIKDLAAKLLDMYKHHPLHRNDTKYSEIIIQNADTFYGKGYQDIYTRVPSIENARERLRWEPKISLEDALKMTLDSFVIERSSDHASPCPQN
ncbi:MAG: bifunctional UDP-4-keto-pentose/UDP-xylose synthase, partial [Desulfomonilia bacterium]